MRAIRTFVRSSWIGRLLLLPLRLKMALGETLLPVGRSVAWTVRSREHHNFTYELDALNVRYLISFVAVVTGQSYATVEKYVREIEQDHELRGRIVRWSQ